MYHYAPYCCRDCTNVPGLKFKDDEGNIVRNGWQPGKSYNLGEDVSFVTQQITTEQKESSTSQDEATTQSDKRTAMESATDMLERSYSNTDTTSSTKEVGASFDFFGASGSRTNTSSQTISQTSQNTTSTSTSQERAQDVQKSISNAQTRLLEESGITTESVSFKAYSNLYEYKYNVNLQGCHDDYVLTTSVELLPENKKPCCLPNENLEQIDAQGHLVPKPNPRRDMCDDVTTKCFDWYHYCCNMKTLTTDDKKYVPELWKSCIAKYPQLDSNDSGCYKKYNFCPGEEPSKEICESRGNTWTDGNNVDYPGCGDDQNFELNRCCRLVSDPDPAECSSHA